MSYTLNKWLTVNPGVKMTPKAEKVIISLDPYFERAKLKARVTRVLSTPDDQLAIIRNFLKIHQLDKKYPTAMICGLMDKVANQYVWQMAWSNLLNIGIIINPPMAAECLMDYVRDGVNKKGKIINQTPHVRGDCFDVGGRGGDNPTIDDELIVMRQAQKDRLPGIKFILAEHGNNCVHTDVE
jgi:hypothetical protein